jgi:tetratricopeptide (TPR) repeat protein
MIKNYRKMRFCFTVFALLLLFFTTSCEKDSKSKTGSSDSFKQNPNKERIMADSAFLLVKSTLNSAPDQALNVLQTIKASNGYLPDQKSLLYALMGKVYSELSETDSALHYFKASSELYIQSFDTVGYISIILEQNKLLREAGQFETALAQSKFALEFHKRKESGLDILVKCYEVLLDNYEVNANFDSAYVVANDFHQLAYEVADSSVYYLATYRLGNALSNLGDYNKAIETLEKSFTYFESHKDVTRLLAISQGLITGYFAIGNHQKVLELLLKQEKYAKLGNDHIMLMNSLANLGTFYTMRGDHEKAKTARKECYEKAVMQQSDRIRFLVSNNIVYNYVELGMPDSAYYYMQIARELVHETQNLDYQGMFLSTETYYYEHMKDFEKVREKSFETLNLYRKLGSISRLLFAYYNLASTYLKSYQLNETPYDYFAGIQYLDTAINIADNAGDVNWIVRINKLKSTLYEENQQFELAYQYLDIARKAEDSVFTSQQAEMIKKLESEYESEKIDADTEIAQTRIQLLEQEKQILQSKRNLLILIIIVLGLSGVSSVIFMRQWHKRRLEAARSQKLALQKEIHLDALKLQQEELEKTRLDKELTHKKRQLITHSMFMIRRNSMIDKVAGITKSTEAINDLSDKRNLLLRLRTTLSGFARSEKEWKEFNHYFESLTKDFYKRLLDKHDGLSPTERKLCGCIKIGMTNKQIATLLNIAPNSVKVSKYRLRKKFMLESNTELVDFILSI